VRGAVRCRARGAAARSILPLSLTHTQGRTEGYCVSSSLSSSGASMVRWLVRSKARCCRAQHHALHIRHTRLVRQLSPHRPPASWRQ
jgi:hypothetical protein